jgi:hypothetical protein
MAAGRTSGSPRFLFVAHRENIEGVSTIDAGGVKPFVRGEPITGQRAMIDP